MVKEQTKGYGKRPLWQWILIYMVIGAIVYFAIYYFVIRGSNNYSTPSATSAPSANQQNTTMPVSPTAATQMPQQNSQPNY